MRRYFTSNIKQQIIFQFVRIGFAFYLIFSFAKYLLISHTRAAIVFILLIASVVILQTSGIGFSLQKPPLQEKVLVRIPQGATLAQIADSLVAKRVLKHKKLFLLLGKVTGKEEKIRAGMFEVPRGLSSWELLNYLETARGIHIKVTLPEGILSFQMAGILQKKIGVDSARFVSLVYDSTFARSLGVDSDNLEGYLLPETYLLNWKMPEEKIIQYLVSNTLRIFANDSVQQQLQLLDMTPRQIIILASVIEGEAQLDSERTLISSVYHNRLRRGWRLQADPTIQFLLSGPPRRLTYADLEIDSPYNTYKYPGLPPGPINNPGKESILAAIFPADTDYLYFVATGDGGHHFSRTAQEHAFWKQKFNEVRKKVRRERRRGQ